MIQPDEDTTLRLWRFVRGDVPALAFAQWAYQEPDLERQLGSALYLALIASDFRDLEAVRRLRERRGVDLRSLPGPDCRCIRLRDLDIVDMGAFHAQAPSFGRDREGSHEDVMGFLEEVRRRGAPFWWLWVARCLVCRQAWLVGSEEWQNDLFCLKRLDAAALRAIEEDDRWPGDFSRYEELLQLGRTAGRSVLFMDPLRSSLRETMADLARERAGIKVSELLSLELADALELAREVESQLGVSFSFGPE